MGSKESMKNTFLEKFLETQKKAPKRSASEPYNLHGGGSRDRTGDLLNAMIEGLFFCIYLHMFARP